MSENSKEKAAEIKTIELITIRPLLGRDLKLVSLIASKMDLNVKNIVSKFLEVRKKVVAADLIKNKEDKEDKTLSLMGDFADIMFKNVIENIHKAYDEINALLSSTTGLSVKELESLEFDVHASLVKKLISNKSFIQLFKS